MKLMRERTFKKKTELIFKDLGTVCSRAKLSLLLMKACGDSLLVGAAFGAELVGL
jgi:hypothetical protein